MVIDRLGCHEELPRDLGVAPSFRDEAEDLDLARGEPCRVAPGGRPWAASNAADPAFPQTPSHPGRRGSRSQSLKFNQRLLLALLPVGGGEDNRSLVIASELSPGRRGGCAVTCKLERIRTGGGLGPRRGRAGAQPPGSEFAYNPWNVATLGDRQRLVR